MGGQASTLSIDNNEFLRSLCDEGVVNSDIRWDLLQQLPDWYPAVLNDNELYKRIEQIGRDITMHSTKTERLGNIVKHQCGLIIQWAANLPEHVPYRQLGNNLYLLQQLIKVAYDTVNGEMEAAEALFMGLPKWNELLTDTLLTFITDHPLINIDPDSVSSRSLAVSCLTVLYSYPLYFAVDMQEPHFFAAYLVHHKDAEPLVSTLLSFISKADYSSVSLRRSSSQSNLMLPAIIPTKERVRSWIRYASTFIVGSQSDISGYAVTPSELTCHLGRRSALLLSILVHRNDPKSRIISVVRDEIETSQCAISVLCDALSRPKALHNPDSVLLLFTMLTENPHMREHLIGLPDLSRLLIPIMEQLYDLDGLWEIPSSLSVLLTVLLILSQYASFHACHDVILPTVPWYTDRILSNISVGSLIVILLVRVIKYNVANAKDMYITRLSLSVISNMGSMLTSMHEYTAQRLIQLTIFLAKKSKVNQTYAELLKNSLHCIFCSLMNNVESNIQIVYELLHHKQLWEEAMVNFDSSQYGFEMQHSGIERCLEYFSNYIDSHADEGCQSVGDITKKLLAACEGWDDSTPTPDDQYIFEYSSDQTFFVPYSWALAVNYYSLVGITWDESRLELLQTGGFGSQDSIEEPFCEGSHEMV